MSVSTSKGEREFLERVKKHTDKVIIAHKDSVQEGFEYFDSDEFKHAYPDQKSDFKNILFSGGFPHFLGMVKIFSKYMGSMMRGRRECFTDLNEYLDELEGNRKLPNDKNLLINRYPNKDIWKEVKEYAWDKWKVTFGFTELPSQLIFKGKAVLFKYALVCIQEMDKEKIALAPKIDAGEEVQRVYSSLGLAVNDIANWLRNKYGIRCQSNHPLGGLVNTTPLAGKAGLGWQGHNGLLITPQYGQRQRIAPIFIEEKLFEYTDNNDYVWIEEFCKTCKRCQKSCPPQAIYSEKQSGIQGISGINQTTTCIDRLKCKPYFNKTLGCSVCIKVCPFSQGAKSYDSIKKAFHNKKNNKVTL